MIYDSLFGDLMTGRFAVGRDDFKVLLVTGKYRPSPSHRTRADINGEVEGAGYAAGGAAVQLAATSNDPPTLELGGATWARAKIRAEGAVYYHARGGEAAADELIAFVSFDEEVISTGGLWVLEKSLLQILNR